jgi:hypothetical protein
LGVVGLWFVLLEFEIWVLLVCEPPAPPPHPQVREFLLFSLLGSFVVMIH